TLAPRAVDKCWRLSAPSGTIRCPCPGRLLYSTGYTEIDRSSGEAYLAAEAHSPEAQGGLPRADVHRGWSRHHCAPPPARSHAPDGLTAPSRTSAVPSSRRETGLTYRPIFGAGVPMGRGPGGRE